jgi:hypothetical protein
LYLEKAIHGLFPKGCLKKKPRFFLWHCRHIVWRGQLFLEKAIHGNGVRHRCYIVFEVLKNCGTQGRKPVENVAWPTACGF